MFTHKIEVHLDQALFLKMPLLRWVFFGISNFCSLLVHRESPIFIKGFTFENLDQPASINVSRHARGTLSKSYGHFSFQIKPKIAQNSLQNLPDVVNISREF